MSGKIDQLINGEFVDAIISVYADLMGTPVLALLFFGATGAAFYIVQQRAIIPVIMLVLVGGVTVANLPAPAGNAIIVLVVVALAVTVFLLYQRALGSSRFK